MELGSCLIELRGSYQSWVQCFSDATAVVGYLGVVACGVIHNDFWKGFLCWEVDCRTVWKTCVIFNVITYLCIWLAQRCKL